jgi:hypothetical protein
MSLRVFTNLLTTSFSSIMSNNSGRYLTYMYIDLLIDNVVRFFREVTIFLGHLSFYARPERPPLNPPLNVVLLFIILSIH